MDLGGVTHGDIFMLLLSADVFEAAMVPLLLVLLLPPLLLIRNLLYMLFISIGYDVGREEEKEEEVDVPMFFVCVAVFACWLDCVGALCVKV